MQITRRLLTPIVLALAALSACGGGGGGSAPPPPPPTPTNAGGVWEGSTFNTNFGLTFATIGVVTENNGEARFINEAGQQFLLSGMSGTNGNFSATVTAIAAPGTVFLNGATTASGTATGTVVERTSMSGDWSLNTGESGTLTLSYDPIYERGSDLDRTVGSWSDSFGTIYTVDANGNLFAQDAFGCVYDGDITIINAAYNAYRVSMTVANCFDMDGNYSGLGVLGDDLGTDDAFFVQIDNGTWIIFDLLLKL